MKDKQDKRTKLISGFTLVELLVATSVFIVVMVMALSSLLTSSDASKKSGALSFAMDNVNFAMESMTRSIRMGKNYVCLSSGSIYLGSVASPVDCNLNTSGGTLLAFVPQEGYTDSPMIAYRRSQREDDSGTYTLERCDDSVCSDIVASNVNIEDLKFFVNGSSTSDLIQPSVYIIIKGVINIKGEPFSFAIQTLASQRSGE